MYYSLFVARLTIVLSLVSQLHISFKLFLPLCLVLFSRWVEICFCLRQVQKFSFVTGFRVVFVAAVLDIYFLLLDRAVNSR